MRLPFKTLLLASAAAATLAAPALAESYFFRTKPLVEAPRTFSFGSESGKNPGTVVESAPVRVSGYRGKTASITGGAYQVCAADCAGAMWTSAPTANLPPEFHARVRATAPAFGATATARLTVGDASATFEVASRARDTTPAALDFPPVANRELNQPAYSAAVAVTDHDGVTLSVSGGGYQICSTTGCSEHNGQAVLTATSAEVASGTLVRLVATPTALGQPTTVTLTAGNTAGTFTATARSADTDPDPVTFAATANAMAGQATDSPIVKLTGHDGVPVSASNAQFRVCTTADCSQSTGWLSSATAAAKDTWAQLRATAPAAGTTANPAPALNYGGRTATWPLSSTAASGNFGINDANLAAAVSAAVTPGSTWVKCSIDQIVGSEPCAGASATLVVVTNATTGYEFGAYYPGDLASYSTCWGYPNGFYFTNVPQRSAYIMHGAGSAGPGRIMVCGNSNFAHLQATTTGKSVITYVSHGEWTAGYSLSGAAGNATSVNATTTWYKRR